MRKLLLTVLLTGVVSLSAGTTAHATVLRLPHKPFREMNRQEKIHYLKRQKWHDNSIIRWSHHHRELADAISASDVMWARKSLVIVRRNLKALTAVRGYHSSGGSVQQVICRVFGSQCAMALRVAYRESRYSLTATNGQYEGLFQMGSSERATYATIGYSTAYEQTVAAHNYFAVAGWGPWSETAY